MKHCKYAWYVLRHKWYVFVECCKLGIPFRGLVHDNSKLRPSEWFSYANHFYGGYPDWDEIKHIAPGYNYAHTKQGAKEEFEIAWHHHQRNNKHHWEYWVLLDPPNSYALAALEMPGVYRKEMLADLRGTGRVKTGYDDTAEWYTKNKERIVLHPRTRAWLEMKLGLRTKNKQRMVDNS